MPFADAFYAGRQYPKGVPPQNTLLPSPAVPANPLPTPAPNAPPLSSFIAGVLNTSLPFNLSANNTEAGTTSGKPLFVATGPSSPNKPVSAADFNIPTAAAPNLNADYSQRTQNAGVSENVVFAIIAGFILIVWILKTK